jgi:hypothetical protein
VGVPDGVLAEVAVRGARLVTVTLSIPAVAVVASLWLVTMSGRGDG